LLAKPEVISSFDGISPPLAGSHPGIFAGDGKTREYNK